MSERQGEDLRDEELEEQDDEILPDPEEVTVNQPTERIVGGGYTMPIEPPATE